MEPLRNKKSPGTAIFLSILLPGLGHFYIGENKRGALYLGLFILAFIIAFPVSFSLMILTAIDSNRLAKQSNKFLEMQLWHMTQTQMEEKPESLKLKNLNTDFVNKIRKNHTLFINGVYSEEEYLKNKSSLIKGLSKVMPNQKNDFLFSLIPLKEDNILDEQEIQNIKSAIE